ncbi:HD-GYP domain-containing protein [Denitratisoma oestradiolicum]|uniref:HD-GYP domain-containing protein n=1 Tax=Denitratisoma oestradiolicum TaxID=311182 RepID=UPI001477440A|nr:HD domain-containing phosphohydrolase [Denitratisoma oestradiolicum]
MRRKLAKPLESSLIVDGAVTFADVVADCLQLIKEQSLLAPFADNAGARAVLSSASSLPISSSLRLLLTSTREDHAQSYLHVLHVVCICAGLAAKLPISTGDTQVLMTAALLHDIGELYINPEYLCSSRRLEPHEWKHVVSHPRIGQLLIQELTTLPPAVGQCVAQHHERLDGSGYPAQVTADRLHRFSAWIAAADATTAILIRGGAGVAARVAMALRIVPEEYDRGVVSVIHQALHQSDNDTSDVGDCDCAKRATGILDRLDQSLREARAIVANNEHAFAVKIVDAMETVLNNLAKSLRSTGVLDAASLGDAMSDPELLSEMCLVVREVEWRLRNLARNLFLRAESHEDPATIMPLVSGLIAIMDDGSGVT